MRIFWSWQSDTHQPTGRHFVRDVLAQVARELNDVEGAEDAERPELEDQEGEEIEPEDGLLHDDGRVEVDHDTHGVGGSPKIAETILGKIADAAVFVADVTPICSTTQGKRVPNPNVMIELGYALKVLGHERIVLVMNQAEGAALKHLPFDLRHWRAPATYKLSREATPERIAQAAAELKAVLRSRIVPGLKLAREQQAALRRVAERAPELLVTRPDQGHDPWIVRQTGAISGLITLEANREETPILPLPAAPDPRFAALARATRGQSSVLANLGRAPPPSAWSREETQGYNVWVERYYADYGAYLAAMADWVRLVERTRTVRLRLENNGTAPATGIDVEVAFPDAVILYDDDHDFPERPKAPEPPPLRPLAPGTGIVRHADFASELARSALLNPPHLLPRSTIVDAPSRTVRFTRQELKHNHSAEIEEFTVTFGSPDCIAPFEAEYVITAREPIDPIRGRIRFEAARDEGSESGDR